MHTQKRWQLMVILLVIVIGIVTYIGCRTVYENPQTVVSGEKYLDREEHLFTDTFQYTDDILSQYFVPQTHGLESIEIRMAVNHAGLTLEGWQLQLSLYDAKDRLLQQSTFDGWGFENWHYYSLPIEANLKAGQVYRLDIQQLSHDAPEGQRHLSYACFIHPQDPAENLTCSFNGTTLSGNIEAIYHYQIIDLAAIVGIFVGDLLIVALLLLRKKLLEIPNKAFGIVLLVLTPIIMFLLVEHGLGNLKSISPVYIIANLVIYYAIFIALTLLFPNAKISTILFGVAFILLTIVQYSVLNFRGRSFTLFDIMGLRTALSVVGSYSLQLPPSMVRLVQGGIILILLQAYFQNLKWPREKRFLAARVFGLLLTAGLMGTLSARENLVVKSDGRNVDLYSLTFWEYESNHVNKGFVFTLFLESRLLQSDAPENYSIQKVNEIAAAAIGAESGSSSTKIQPENLIVIMNESFADLECINSIQTENELLPFMDSLDTNVIKGWLHVPVFGGSTVESEYEVLTGNTRQFLPHGVASYYAYCKDPEYGLPHHAKQAGYQAIALHPFWGANWNRIDAYPKLGFDEFISSEVWDAEFELARWHVSDQSAYNKIIDLVEQSDNKLFTFLVTMQNHGGYDETPGYETDVTLNYDTAYPDAEIYLSLINDSDQALKNLIHYFEDHNEPTMIVMFGDHLPSLDEAFYEELFGCPSGERTLEQEQLRYRTPFVIWANYPLDAMEEQTMSANYFGSFIKKCAGLELTTYDQFLLALQEEIPVIGQGAIRDADGAWHTMDELPAEHKSRLNEYEILQYNRIFDRANVQEDIFMPTVSKGGSLCVAH